MKKTVSILMVILILFSLVGCGQPAADENNGANASSSEAEPTTPQTDAKPTISAENGSETTEAPEENGKILVAYFSWSGNTEEMASYIAEQTGGDLYEIEPQNAYPTDYNECGDVALIERDENARPPIANLPDSIEEYDTIFIGYPKMEQGFSCV